MSVDILKLAKAGIADRLFVGSYPARPFSEDPNRRYVKLMFVNMVTKSHIDCFIDTTRQDHIISEEVTKCVAQALSKLC